MRLQWAKYSTRSPQELFGIMVLLGWDQNNITAYNFFSTTMANGARLLLPPLSQKHWAAAKVVVCISRAVMLYMTY